MFSLEALISFFVFVVVLSFLLSLQAQVFQEAQTTLRDYQTKLEIEETVAAADLLYLNTFNSALTFNRKPEETLADVNSTQTYSLFNSLTGQPLQANEVKNNAHYR